MASLALLRKQAKEAGIAAAVIRKASTAEELQSVIDDHTGGSKPVKKGRPVAKKKATTVAKKTTAARKPVKRNSTKPAGPSRKPAASSRKNSGKAKRTTAGTGSNGYVAKGGRNTLDGVDYSVTDGWNPRKGSAPDQIIRALKKARGNREKAFDALVGDVWNFVGKKMRDGSKRSKPDAEAMLRYRISRTAWDFALRTGQHEKSGNRVEYGTGGTGTGAYKPARKAPARSAAKKTTARKGGNKKRTTKKR